MSGGRGCKEPLLLDQRVIADLVEPGFRRACLHLRQRITAHYPLVREFGIRFSVPLVTTTGEAADAMDRRRSMPASVLTPSSAPSAKSKRTRHASSREGEVDGEGGSSSSGSRIRGARQRILSFWAAVRKESLHREVYACFLLSICDKNANNSADCAGLNASMERLSYALSLVDREI